MKCPCCGSEMCLDGHRKIDLFMCYNCGYIEGRDLGENLDRKVTDFEHLHSVNVDDATGLVSK